MSSDIPALIAGADSGDSSAAEALFTALYSELHRLAEQQLRRQAVPLTLSPTTVLHEAYLDLKSRSAVAFPDHGHFMAYAARAMRGLIIDYARRRGAQKRGGALEIVALGTEPAVDTPGAVELERVADAVDALAKIEPRLANVVNLRFFSGFSFAEIAAMCGTSERTVQRDWEKARMLLYESLGDSAHP